MEGEWNEENWFDLADYADIDMDAGFDYEPSDASSDGNVASGDHSSGDYTTDGVEEGSSSPTMIRPDEEPVSSEGKGLFNHNKYCPKASSGHDEGSLSKCSNPPKAVRLGAATSGSGNFGSLSAPGGSLSPVSPAKDAIKHAIPACSTIPTQGSTTDGDGYNLEFPFLEGFAPSRQMVSFDDSSSEEASNASGDHQWEVFVLPSCGNNSPGNRTENTPRRSHSTTARGIGEDTSSDEQSQYTP